MNILIWFGIMAQCTLSAWVSFLLAQKTTRLQLEFSLEVLGILFGVLCAFVLIIGGIHLADTSFKTNKLEYINTKCKTEFTLTDLEYNKEFIERIHRKCSEKAFE